MPIDEFLETVRQEASFESTELARSVTEATIYTLGERITDGEASNLAQSFPANLAEILTDASPGEAEPFSLDVFIERVSERADIDESNVIESCRGVATALRTHSDVELEAAREQLPSEFDVIFEPAGAITEDEFLETVQQRGDLNSIEEAREATVATLRTLGERLSEGEAEDLALYLPSSLEEAIVDAGDESATDYSFDEFVQRASQREGVEKESVTTHVRAVGSALAETASERELGAAKKQLPNAFGVIFEPPETSNNGTIS